MKKALFAIAILFSISASAQDLPNYSDSNITLQLTQRAALYVGRGIQQSFTWNNRLAPATLKNYVGSGLQLDSLFSVTLKAGYIKQMIELLINGSNEAVQVDRLSIINNSPAIPGYTSLASQIVTKANGNTSEKQVAIFIRDYYNQRVADFAAVRAEVISDVIKWANN
jgi:hypothetical protein